MDSRTGTGIGPAVGSSNGGVAVTVTTIPEAYAVVFKCSQHGETFSVDSKKLFGKLEIGQKVKIRYREIRRKWINKGELVDFDFIGTEEGDQ